MYFVEERLAESLTSYQQTGEGEFVRRTNTRCVCLCAVCGVGGKGEAGYQHEVCGVWCGREGGEGRGEREGEEGVCEDRRGEKKEKEGGEGGRREREEKEGGERGRRRREEREEREGGEV